MSIRTLIAAAVTAVGAAVGIGQAEAATHDIVFTVTDAYVAHVPIYDDQEPSREDLPGYWGFLTGNPVRGTLTVSDGPDMGTLIATLIVGGTTLYDHLVSGSANDFTGIEGSSGFVWDALEWNGSTGLFQFTQDERPQITLADASIALAPVPLPATAALLPIGIGALALMRRRRRLPS